VTAYFPGTPQNPCSHCGEKSAICIDDIRRHQRVGCLNRVIADRARLRFAARAVLNAWKANDGARDVALYLRLLDALKSRVEA
jgi:hypothetical protein